MTAPSSKFAALAAAAALIAGCAQKSADAGTAGDSATAGTTAGSTTGTGTGTGAGTGSGSSLPALVNVNLENVLNDLSVAIKVDRANIPVNAQVPIEVAANVCGVSVAALAASIASGQAGCTATTMSPQLTQAVQQQVAAGGSVTGGPQTMGTTNNMM
jgi:hypothetical protein